MTSAIARLVDESAHRMINPKSASEQPEQRPALIIAIDDEVRRLVYAVIDGARPPLRHHHASFQVLPDGDGHSRLLWITDLLPDSLAGLIEARTAHGIKEMKEAGWPPVEPSTVRGRHRRLVPYRLVTAQSLVTGIGRPACATLSTGATRSHPTQAP